MFQVRNLHLRFLWEFHTLRSSDFDFEAKYLQKGQSATLIPTVILHIGTNVQFCYVRRYHAPLLQYGNNVEA